MSTQVTQKKRHSFDVPEGADALPDPVTRVIVIGGGFAGLTVANALHAAGVEVVVLEARTRLGGRTHTVELAGVKVDAGGSWIHRPEGNPLAELAQVMGIEQRSFAISTIFAGMRLVDAQGQALSALQRDRLMALADEMEEAIVDQAAQCAPGESIEGLLAEQLEGIADSQERQWLAFALRLGFEADLASPLSDISAANFAGDDGYGGGDHCLAGGYASMVEPLSAGLPVRLASVVSRVVIDEAGVRVCCADGHVEQGSQVVVTVPLGVLKARAIEFQPPLPAGKQAAIDRLGFGRFEKLILQFERRFWASEAPVSGLLVRGEPVFPYWIDLTPIAGRPTLAAHISGPPAARLAELDSASALARALEVLKQATGCEVPLPVAVYRTGWSADPYSRGSYLHHGVESLPQDMGALAEPAHGRLLFAGEATSALRFGYVDGAFSSGLREAARLLGSGRVALSVDQCVEGMK